MTEQSLPKFAAGDIIAKKYEIVRMLGEGMSGCTYVARHTASGKELVIRFTRPRLVAQPKDRERLRQLFERARGLRHDLLVRYGEIGISEDLVYTTEELFPSESLREVIDATVAENRAFTLQEACQLAISVLEAVEVAHAAGIVHRNLKPENVLVSTKRIGPAASAKLIRTIKISGTGLAGIINLADTAEGFVTREDAPYLAPEMTGYDQDCGPQADIYSVGVMLYEMLCGQRPIGTYISPSQLREDIPQHVDDIVQIALSHSADDRYPTARDMINDIQRSFTLEVQAGRTVVSFRNIMIGLGAVIALAVAVGAYVLTIGKPDPLADAQRRDAEVRRAVKVQNPPPDKAVVKTMLEKHPEMLYVPQGTFLFGRYAAEPDTVSTTSEPLHVVVKVPAFFIDRYEFPNKPDTKPAVRVTWDQARDACATTGKRLCTEHEWEKACKGPDNQIYAYADAYQATCSVAVDASYALGGRDTCLSGYGVYDLSGGLREWTADAHPGKKERKIVKGGLRANPERGTRCAYAVDESSGFAETALGFRCCLNADGTADAPAAPAPPAPPAP